MADPVVPRSLHDVEGADHVRVEIGARILQAVAHARLRGEVDDGVGGKGVDRGVQSFAVLQHRLDRREARFLGQDGMASLFDADIVIVGHAVIAADGEPFCQQ